MTLTSHARESDVHVWHVALLCVMTHSFSRRVILHCTQVVIQEEETSGRASPGGTVGYQLPPQNIV